MAIVFKVNEHVTVKAEFTLSKKPEHGVIVGMYNSPSKGWLYEVKFNSPIPEANKFYEASELNHQGFRTEEVEVPLEEKEEVSDV